MREYLKKYSTHLVGLSERIRERKRRELRKNTKKEEKKSKDKFPKLIEKEFTKYPGE